MNEKSFTARALEARAEVARRKILRDAARAVWEAAYRAANPDAAAFSEDPEVEWAEPASEEEAERDLNVARLGGELCAAERSLWAAENRAKALTQQSMQEAAREGREAWRARHGSGD